MFVSVIYGWPPKGGGTESLDELASKSLMESEMTYEPRTSDKGDGKAVYAAFILKEIFLHSSTRRETEDNRGRYRRAAALLALGSSLSIDGGGVFVDGIAEPVADGAGAQAQGRLSQDQVRVMKGPSNGARNQEQTTRVQNPRMRAVLITSLFLAAVLDLAERSLRMLYYMESIISKR